MEHPGIEAAFLAENIAYTDRGSVYWKGAKAAEACAKAPLWQPAWLPEGWALEHGSTRDGVWPETHWEYRRGEETLSVTVCAPSNLFFCHLMDHEAGGKETMLRMAESVEPGRAPSWPAPASAAKAPASNAPAPVPSASSDPNASRRSWAADGWTASVTHADGTVERIPNFSELFPGQDLPRQR